MHRIDHSTAAASLPTPAAAGTPGYFTKGNPGTGTPATVVTDDWLNSIQEENIAILAAAGITPSKTVRNQVLVALTTLFGGSGSLGVSGWWKLPGGLIIQWGPTPSLGASTGASMTYPIAFPNTFYAAFAIGGATSPGVGPVGIDNGSGSKTSLGIWSGSGGALAGHFIALGK